MDGYTREALRIQPDISLPECAWYRSWKGCENDRESMPRFL